MTLQIRRFRPSDIVAVRRIVDDAWSDDEIFRGRIAHYRASGDDVTLVAVSDGSIVGGVSARPGRSVPRSLIHIDVAEKHRRFGVGTALLTELRRLTAGCPVMVRVRPWDDASVGFFSARGFSIVERALEGRIAPGVPPISRWIDDRAPSRAGSLRVVPVREDDPARRNVARVLAAWFERIHRWLPQPPISPSDAERRFLEPALPGTVHAAVWENRVVGAGLLFDDPTRPGTTGSHLAFAGVGEDGHPGEEAIVGALVAAVLQAAAADGRTVFIEATDRYPPGRRVMDSIPTDDLFEGLWIMIDP